MKAIIANSSILQNVIVPNTLTLSGTLTGNNDYSAVEIITSTQVINSGSTSYKSGSEIILKPGFNVKAGSNFHAHIYSCGNSHLLFDHANEVIGEKNDHSQFAMSDPSKKMLMQEVVQSKKVIIHPNPNSGTFQLETNFPLTEIGNLKITNMMGATVYETQNVVSPTVQLLHPTAGPFFVVMILKDGVVLTKKMIIQ
jgi:hypothetical protein